MTELPMDCRRFEELLPGALSGDPDARALAARAHAAACPHCAGLLRAAEGRGESPPDADAFVREVLVRTSGAACARVERLLCAVLDGESDADTAALVRGHLGHCAPCAEVAGVLRALSAELPALAEIEPDGDFLRDVLAATTKAGRVATAASAQPVRGAGAADPNAARANRFREIRPSLPARLLHRPRFAFEAAFSAAMVAMLLYGPPASPLRGTPDRVLEVARLNPVEAIAEIFDASPAGRSGASAQPAAPAVTLGRAAASTGRKMIRTVLLVQGELGRAWGAIWSGDFLEAAGILHDLTRKIDDGGTKPNETSAAPPDPGAQRTEPSPTGARLLPTETRDRALVRPAAPPGARAPADRGNG